MTSMLASLALLSALLSLSIAYSCDDGTLANACDAVSVDCPDGKDETRLLCEDEERWGDGAHCPGPGWQACQLGRPGQCFRAETERCDGVYHCVDRGDEDGCEGQEDDDDEYEGLFSAGDLTEDMAEKAAACGAAALLIGL